MKELKVLSDLIGLEVKTITGDIDSEELIFEFTDGNKIKMYHCQECCEHVRINDIDGDIQDLVGGTVVQFDESVSAGKESELNESETWTFYNIATTKEFVNIRWLGESNGYYSERVDIAKHPYDWSDRLN